MIEKFLKAKHWQLFLLTFGIPIAFQFIAIGMMIWKKFEYLDGKRNTEPEFIANYFMLFPLIMILFIGVFMGWFWSVAIGLQGRVPANVKMKVGKFRILFSIPLVYMSLIILFTVAAITGMTGGAGKLIVWILTLAVIIIPLHLLSIFCMFYSLYFVAKTFKTVELQREVSFSDFAGEFFLIWFYPVGIWIVQPKINKMVEK